MKATFTPGRSILVLCLFISVQAQAQLANGKCKFLGNIYQGGTVPANFTELWNQVTPENAGKWGVVEGTRDNMNWGGLDAAFNLAKDNGFPFKQHTFIWGNQFPGWIQNLPPEEQLEEIEEWISAFCERYQGSDADWPEELPFYIDVVNEPVNDPPSAGNGNFRDALGGTGETGWDWVVKAFELAREYCPKARLLVNEYNIVNNGGNASTYFQLISVLKERELIDGIGVQGHTFSVNAPVGTIQSNLDYLAGTGLPIYVSEFEIADADDAAQDAAMQEKFKLLWEHPAIQGITLWGYQEGNMWQADGYLIRSNGSYRPAMQWLNNYVRSAPGGTFCVDLTGFDDPEDAGINIFPNPVMDGKLRFSGIEKVKAIHVMNTSGQVLRSFNPGGLNSMELELNVKPGLHVIELVTEGKSFYKKIVVGIE